MDPLYVYLGLAALFGLFMAWGIGANDVANAMATSIGSGALTVKQALLVAAVFDCNLLQSVGVGKVAVSRMKDVHFAVAHWCQKGREPVVQLVQTFGKAVEIGFVYGRAVGVETDKLVTDAGTDPLGVHRVEPDMRIVA